MPTKHRHHWHPTEPPPLKCPQTEVTIVRPSDWTTIPKPQQIAALPIDPVSGYPIFFTVQHDRLINFRSMNPRKVITCAREQRCGICGQRLDYWICFAGGPKSAASRVFTDPPMHQECLDYAWRVCPWLIHNGFTRPESRREDGMSDRSGDLHKPEKLGVYLTRGYKLIVPKAGAFYFKADAPKAIEWRTVVKEGTV